AANPIEIASYDPITGEPLVRMPLALDHEFREIRKKIIGSRHGNGIEIIPHLAATPDDLMQALNEDRPGIVHFSGHGTATNHLVLVDESGQPKFVTKDALKSLFKTLRDDIRVVVLNARYSKDQALAITKHIDCAVGMKREIGDDAAIKFAGAFYRAIGFGRSV